MRNYSNLFALTLLLWLLTACGDPVSPNTTPPSNINATPGPGYITVTWEDNSDDETGFVIYRSVDAAVSAQAQTEVGEVAADEETFIDTEVDLEIAYSYQVAAKSAAGESREASAAPAKVAQGIDLIVGTHNLSSVGLDNRTVFFMFAMLPESLLEVEAAQITFEGPAGWKDDEVVSDEFSTELLKRGWAFWNMNSVEAVAGDYSVSLSLANQTFKASARLEDASYRYPQASNITANLQDTIVSASWDNPAGAGAAWVELWRSDFSERLEQNRISEQTHTFETQLEPGSYVVGVAPIPLDLEGTPIKIEPFGISFDHSESFTVAPPNSTFYSVLSTGAYLQRRADDNADPATAISLIELGADAGTCLSLVKAGDYSPRILDNRPDVSTSMIAVFSGPDGFIAPGSKGTQEAVETKPTSNGIVTDIPQDFNLAGQTIVEVPPGASDLLFSPDDTAHYDNGDPDNDYGVWITEVACPAISEN